MGSSKQGIMLLTFKTLDHKIFKYEVSEEDTLDDIKTRIEEDFGQENIYKLIYSGKILRDDQQLKSYKINEKQFVVLMITKPHKKEVQEETKDDIQVETKEEIKEDIKETYESYCKVAQKKYVEEEIVLEPIKDEESQEVDECRDDDDKDSIPESIPSLSLDSDEEISFSDKVGLEWIEEEIKKKSENHFLTDKDFSIALDVVMDMEYLADIGNRLKTVEDVQAFLDRYFKDKSFLHDIKTIAERRIDDIIAVNPNSKQLDAFLTDLISIYALERVKEPTGYNRIVHDSEDDDSDDEDDEDDIEVIVTAFQRNVENIVAMGFIREEVEVALRAAFNNPDQAVDYLIGGIPPSAFAPEENPLAFLRNNVEFQHIRYLVQSDPATLQPLLLSFGQKHPELMATINKNKLSFVRMLHEPDGAKGFGDDSSLVVDPANNNSHQSHSR